MKIQLTDNQLEFVKKKLKESLAYEKIIKSRKDNKDYDGWDVVGIEDYIFTLETILHDKFILTQ